MLFLLSISRAENLLVEGLGVGGSAGDVGVTGGLVGAGGELELCRSRNASQQMLNACCCSSSVPAAAAAPRIERPQMPVDLAARAWDASERARLPAQYAPLAAFR